MQKRKMEKSESCAGSSAKQQCTESTAQQLRNQAREKIIAERKERNRRSAAASRKKKDDEITQLREQVKKLTESNNVLMKIVMQLPQGQGLINQAGVLTSLPSTPCTNSNLQTPTLNSNFLSSSIVEDDSNSNSNFSVVSDQEDLSVPSTFSSSMSTKSSSSSLLSDYTSSFSPNSSEPAAESIGESCNSFVNERSSDSGNSRIGHNSSSDTIRVTTPNSQLKKFVVPQIQQESYVVGYPVNVSSKASSSSSSHCQHILSSSCDTSEAEGGGGEDDNEEAASEEDWMSLFSTEAVLSTSTSDPSQLQQNILLDSEEDFWDFGLSV